MFISNNIINYNSYNNFTPNKSQNISRFRDVSCSDTVCFTSKENVMTIEDKLKTIPKLHDPYSDIIMISDPEYKVYMNKVAKRPNAITMLNLLSTYKENLFEPEETACDFMRYKLKEYKETGKNKKPINKIDFSDLIQDLYPEAKERLVIKQKNKVAEVHEYLSTVQGEQKDKLLNIFSTANESIDNDTFRITPYIADVRALKGVDKNVKKNILDIMQTFPNSRNSVDVFIINNINKTHEEIAEAIITPSRVSIEHIKPQSLNGPSSISNYLVASKRMNSVRSSTPLAQFISIYPEIPSCTQRYFDDIVRKINRGGISYVTPHLVDITNTLRTQSKGLIDIEVIDLSDRELHKNDAFKKKLDEFMKHFGK